MGPNIFLAKQSSVPFRRAGSKHGVEQVNVIEDFYDLNGVGYSDPAIVKKYARD